MDFSMFIAALPEVYVGITIIGLFALGIFVPKLNSGNSFLNRSLWNASVLSIIIGIIIIYTLSSITSYGFNGLFVTDPITYIYKLFLLFSTAVVISISYLYAKEKSFASYEYAILIILATLGMMVMISANNFLTFYVGIELSSLSMYIMLALDKRSIKSTESSLKYYILGALSSGMLLYGISFIYGVTGYIDYQEIMNVLSKTDQMRSSILLTLGIVFILIGTAFKFSAVPFHMWTPDVFEGASIPMVSLFATSVKLAVIASIIRIFWGVFQSVSSEWQQIILVLSAASMIVGSVMAVYQLHIKKVIAYTSIASAGYVFMAILVPSASSLSAITIYMIIHSLTSLGFFVSLMLIRKNGEFIESISDLKGLSVKSPFLAFSITAFLFSMAGIPPLAGFMGKFYIFLVLLEEGYLWLAIVGILASVISAFYFLRIIKSIYFDENDDPASLSIVKFNLGFLIVLLMLFFTLFFIAFSGSVFSGMVDMFNLVEFLPK